MNEQVIKLIENKLNIFKSSTSSYIYLFGPVKMPIKISGKITIFNWYTWFKNNKKWSVAETLAQLPKLKQNELQQSSILTLGDLKGASKALVRLHSICHTGDIFGSQRCDCGVQLYNSLKKIRDNKSGAVFYLANHEGRGIGLLSKSMTYALQENGFNTVEANLALGYEEDLRTYEDVTVILKEFREKPITLLTNNPQKIKYLKEHDINVAGTESILGEISEYNLNYLKTKVEKMNHLINI